MKKLRNSRWDRHGVLESILKGIPLPPMIEAVQHFPAEKITDLDQAVRSAVSKEITAIKGKRIAVTAGSRGVARIAEILRVLGEALKEAGARPFIVPAMGSHGGATAEGQSRVLENLGINPVTTGMEIRSSMETTRIGTTDDGRPVFIDRHAARSDGIVVVGRVKPHSSFRGSYESGLIKMMAIGLGKQKGAEACHAAGFSRMADNIVTFGKVVLDLAPILFGLAVMENAYDEPWRIEALPRDQILEQEPKLLEAAWSQMPSLPFTEFDVLVVNQIGKNFSGTGMDPNISGSFSTPYADGGPQVQRYVVLDLSPETRGNAYGIGLADFTTKRVFDKTDFDAFYPNALTSKVPASIKIPLVLANDRLAIAAAIYTCDNTAREQPRIVRIENTAHIDRMWISAALLPEAEKRQIPVRGGLEPLRFDTEGNFI